MPDQPRSLALPDIEVESLEVLDDTTPGFLALHRRRLRVRYPDGSWSAPFLYDAVTRHHLDAVVIAAYYERAGKRRVFLRSAVRPPVTYRDPARSAVPEARRACIWELPAGLVEADEETSLDGVALSARRELREEVGFEIDASRFQMLGPSMFVAPGFIAERHYFFAVRVDPNDRADPSLDGSPLERDGVVIDVTLEAALDMCHRGEIEDEKTELGLRRLQELP